MMWHRFVCVDTDLGETYSRPIFNQCRPYAVLRCVGDRAYEVSGAETNRGARLIAEHAFLTGSIGIRIYLKLPDWFGQVFYYGGPDESAPIWLTDNECVRSASVKSNHYQWWSP